MLRSCVIPRFSTRTNRPAHLACAERCLGGQLSTCASGYTGDYCAQCDTDFYAQGDACLPCTPGETQRLYAVLGAFVLVLQLFLFFAPADLAVAWITIVSHLKVFRAVGSYALVLQTRFKRRSHPKQHSTHLHDACWL